MNGKKAKAIRALAHEPSQEEVYYLEGKPVQFTYIPQLKRNVKTQKGVPLRMVDRCNRKRAKRYKKELRLAVAA